MAGSNWKVSGKSSAIAIVAERPGIAPTNMPIRVPRTMTKILIGCTTLVSPIHRKVSFTSGFLYAPGKSGIGNPRKLMKTAQITPVTAITVSKMFGQLIGRSAPSATSRKTGVAIR